MGTQDSSESMLSRVLLSHRVVIPILAAPWKRYANTTLEK